MAPRLYKADVSPPVRSVYLTAKVLGVELEYTEIDLAKRDTLKPEFMKINPQHTIPVLDDDGTIIWDSHAINAYLVSKYGKDDSLYPRDPAKRAVVDQRLHFDTGVLFATLKALAAPIFYHGEKTIRDQGVTEANQAYEFLEAFLKNRKWLAGDSVTLADYSAIPNVTSINVLVPINPTKYPNVIAWIKRAEEWPYYNLNKKGLDDFRAAMSKALS